MSVEAAKVIVLVLLVVVIGLAVLSILGVEWYGEGAEAVPNPYANLVTIPIPEDVLFVEAVPQIYSVDLVISMPGSTVGGIAITYVNTSTDIVTDVVPCATLPDPVDCETLGLGGRIYWEDRTP